MSEHGRMSKKLMADVGLGAIERLAVMSDVLGRVKDSEGKRVEKFSLCEQSAHWLQPPSCLFVKEFRYII